jgi:hypothetical protein
MRFRLRTLLIATAWAGLVFLGLRSPSPVMSGIISTVTLVTILLAVLVTIYCTGTSRAMAIGYLLFCAGYLIHLTFLAGWMSRSMGDASISLWSLFFQLFEIVHPNNPSIPIPLRNASRSNFTAIGHNAIACLLGMAGAMAAQILYRRQHPEGSSVQSP